MRDIYVQEKIIIRILMMHQSRKEIGYRIPFTYMHMIPILRFFTPFYTENYLLNFICHHKYTHIRTYSTIPIITNIFIKQSINIGEGGKNIKGVP